MDKKEKKDAIDELHEKFARAKTAVITGYSGINVEQITDLRARLRKSQVPCLVTDDGASNPLL